MKTQSQRIIDYIDKKGTISSMEAARCCGIVSLQTLLTKLRYKGYVFNWVYDGKGQGQYKRYSIKKRPKKCQ